MGELSDEVEERGPTSSRCAGAGEEGDEVRANNGESVEY